MANAWKRAKTPSLLSSRPFFFFISTSFLFLISFVLYFSSKSYPTFTSHNLQTLISPIAPFNCEKSEQARPVIANVVEGIKYPFIYSLSDLGTLPEKPHKNIVRTLRGKPFRKPDISATVQEQLEKMRMEGKHGLVVDVGANVGMATFAAAVMGFKVLAFEPVLENLQRLCEGVFFNRVGRYVTVFDAVVSDLPGNITFHKLVGRLDNSAVSEVGAKLAFKRNEEVALEVRSVRLDDIIMETDPVLLLKVDTQGWETHVLKGASKLLSRAGGRAPYLIYEEDERLLSASNSSAGEIRRFLTTLGYTRCTRHLTDAHCTKTLI